MQVANAPSFSERLKAFREEAGLSQRQLAERAELSTAALSRIESGDREPGWQTVLKLAKALGISVAAFEPLTEPVSDPTLDTSASESMVEPLPEPTPRPLGKRK